MKMKSVNVICNNVCVAIHIIANVKNKKEKNSR